MRTIPKQIRRLAVLFTIMTLVLAAMPLAGSAQDTADDQKERCKNGGWQTLTGADGNAFSNQGECVSYIATGGTFDDTTVPDSGELQFNGTVVDLGGGISGCDFSIALTGRNPDVSYTASFPFGYHTWDGGTLYDSMWQYFPIEFPMTVHVWEYDAPETEQTYTIPSCGSYSLSSS